MSSTAPILSTPIKLATFNANGLRTKVYAGSNYSLRQSLVLKFFRRTELSVMGIQEPHLRTLQDLEAFVETVSNAGLHYLGGTTPVGRGGVGLIYSAAFTVHNSWSIAPRIMFCTLHGPDTVPLSVLTVHLHHDAGVRRSQLTAIKRVRHLIPESTVVLGDFNSVILPSRDVSATHEINEQPAVLRAREEELSLATSLGLVDSFACAHAGRATEHDLAGWTWGFPGGGQEGTSHQPPPQQDPNPPPGLDRKRRIDRILVPGPFGAFISQAYTTFLANSDHKALVVQLSPKTTVPVNKRKRCPVGFLKEEKLVEGLKLALADLPGSDLDWRQAVVGLVTKKDIQYEVVDRSGPPP